MVATTHLAVGAAVGLWSSRLVDGMVDSDSAIIKTAVQAGTAFVAATISHIILDAIPHNDGIYKTSYGTAPVLGLELAVIFSIIAGIVTLNKLNPIIIFAGLVGAAWLDILPKPVLGILLHKFFHSVNQTGLAGSLTAQFIISVIALLFLI